MRNDILKTKALNLAKAYLKNDCNDNAEISVNYLQALTNACKGLSVEDIFKLQHMAQIYQDYYTATAQLKKQYNYLKEELSKIESSREKLSEECKNKMEHAERGIVVYEG